MRKRWDGTKFVSLDGEPEAAPVKAVNARPDAMTTDNLDAHIRRRIDEALEQYSGAVRKFVGETIAEAIKEGTLLSRMRERRNAQTEEAATPAPLDEETDPGKGQDAPK